MCTNFQKKRTFLTFWTHFYAKVDLGSKLQKSKSGFRIRILEILSLPIFRQNGWLRIFRFKCAQKWLLGSKFQKSKPELWISTFEILYVLIFKQNGWLRIFGAKIAQKWILGPKSQKAKSGFRINTCNIPCVPIFSQNGQLLILRPKFGEIAQLRAIFCSKYSWECCRELGKVKMRWLEMDEAGSRWMDLGWGGCTV